MKGGRVLHSQSDFYQQIGELLKVIIPLLTSLLAYRRGTKALHKARAVEAACSYPACGHLCHEPRATVKE